MAILDRLMSSWRASADLHRFRAGVTEADIREFESRAGWKLPTDWRQFYLFSNGADLFKECLRIYPLLGGERSLLGAAARLRGSNWRVPEELWIAGDDGSEDHFGLWLPCATEETAPVVQMGEIFEDDNLALAGSSLQPFLAANSAYLLLSSEATPPLALDALEVPSELRFTFSGEESWHATAIFRWADPAGPGNFACPYVARLDPREVTEELNSDASWQTVPWQRWVPIQR